MKVYVFPADNAGCGHYRLIWPADTLKRLGHDIVIMPPVKEAGFLIKTEVQDDGTEKIIDVQVPPGADVVVLQRASHRRQRELITFLRAKGVAVVVDMDDDMSSIHPDNVTFHAYRHDNRTDYSWKWALESAKVATLVTTSTTALQKVYAPHGRGMVLDNYVPEATLFYDKPSTGCFGWAGTTLSHPNDLQEAGDTVRRMVNEGHSFRVVGGPSKVRQNLRLSENPTCTGTVELQHWIRTIAETMDVGMVPLAPTSFNTSKSRLKGMECMAAGVPWVASPRAEYRRLNKESGCGFLADTPKQWYAHLTRLMTDDVLRKEQAEAGKEYMQTQTYQANAWRFLEAWTRAVEIQHGGR
jgi:hypothetical protein